ncbi:hypothetical protein EMPG_16273 [Blastomyces silverae]|uniref:Uncharacterized protein n=1 Tax=Blastomyces silverae TaxID=2060906 RepID=A0A0H1BB53_9EURO|nr:hypothetical protein EMPG_16273 [Blastomyces silverae]
MPTGWGNIQESHACPNIPNPGKGRQKGVLSGSYRRSNCQSGPRSRWPPQPGRSEIPPGNRQSRRRRHFLKTQPNKHWRNQA